MNPVYVYGIVRAGHSLGDVKDAGHGVEAIEFHNLAAVVGEIQNGELGGGRDLNLLDETWLETWATRHVDVISAVFTVTDILPLKFATLCSDRSRVRDLVRTGYDSLAAGLERVARAEEYVVSAWTSTTGSWVVPVVDRKVTPGKVYLMERRVEIRSRRLPGRSGLEAACKPAGCLERLAREHRVLAPEVEGAVRDAHIVYKSAFLVDRRRREAFLAAAQRWRDSLAETAYSLAWSGPWPPFNFAQPGGGRR